MYLGPIWISISTYTFQNVMLSISVSAYILAQCPAYIGDFLKYELSRVTHSSLLFTISAASKAVQYLFIQMQTQQAMR